MMHYILNEELNLTALWYNDAFFFRSHFVKVRKQSLGYLRVEYVQSEMLWKTMKLKILFKIVLDLIL